LPDATVLPLEKTGKYNPLMSTISRMTPSTTSPPKPNVFIIPTTKSQRWHDMYHLLHQQLKCLQVLLLSLLLVSEGYPQQLIRPYTLHLLYGIRLLPL